MGKSDPLLTKRRELLALMLSESERVFSKLSQTILGDEIMLDKYKSSMKTLFSARRKSLDIINRASQTKHKQIMPFLELVEQVQRDILANTSNPYYREAYKAAEIDYWYELAMHIYDRHDEEINYCLDIGCAYGTLAVMLKKLFSTEVHCIDFVSHYMNTQLVNKMNLKFQISNIEVDALPWEVKYDIIILTEVIEHFNFHPLPTLQKISDLLSDTGALYLSTPNANFWGRVEQYYNSLDKLPMPSGYIPGSYLIDDHVYVYREDELLGLFEKAGLRVVCNFSHEKHLQFVLTSA